jgi:hypothetical protein
MADLCGKQGVSDGIVCWWKAEDGGLHVSEAFEGL